MSIRLVMHKKRPRIFTFCRVSKAKYYLYHGFDDRLEHPSVQIISSSPSFAKDVVSDVNDFKNEFLVWFQLTGLVSTNVNTRKMFFQLFICLFLCASQALSPPNETRTCSAVL